MKALNVAQPYAAPTTYYDASAKVLEKTFFLIKFAPSPWSNPDNFETLPTVEVEIGIDPYTGNLSTPRIHAISSHATADVLMPDAASDVRYVRRVNVPLDASTPEVDEFMKRSNLDLFRSDVLRPAAQATFKIPGWLAGDNENDTVQKEYIYTHLEYKSGVQFDWQGLPLWFTDIESGSTGGKRSEVMIEYQELGHGAIYKSAKGLLGNEQSLSDASDFNTLQTPRASAEDDGDMNRFLTELDDTEEEDDMSLVDDALFALDEPGMDDVETNQDVFSAPMDDMDDEPTNDSELRDSHKVEQVEDSQNINDLEAAHDDKVSEPSWGDHDVFTSSEDLPQSTPLASSSTPSSEYESTSGSLFQRHDEIDLPPLIPTTETKFDHNTLSSPLSSSPSPVEDFTSFITKIRNFISQLQPEIKQIYGVKYSKDDNNNNNHTRRPRDEIQVVQRQAMVKDEIPFDRIRDVFEDKK